MRYTLAGLGDMRKFVSGHADFQDNELKHLARPPKPLVGQEALVKLLRLFHLSHASPRTQAKTARPKSPAAPRPQVHTPPSGVGYRAPPRGLPVPKRVSSRSAKHRADAVCAPFQAAVCVQVPGALCRRRARRRRAERAGEVFGGPQAESAGGQVGGVAVAAGP
jgi:hypothetical protein